MMTRKNFEAIAAIVKDEVEATLPLSDPATIVGAAYGIEELAKSLADYFASDNPNFDRRRFLTACGLD